MDLFLTGRGGGGGGQAGSYKPPILDENYPNDISLTVIRGNKVSASFNISIVTPGVPADYTYQWYVDGVPVNGAISATFAIMSITAQTNSTVYCEVTNSAGTVTSRIATLNVEEYYLPTLDSSYPKDVSVIQSSSASATFTVSISSDGNPNSYTYQWYVNDSAVDGATSSSYTKSGLTSVTSYSVYCKITNDAGMTQSRTATLTVQTSTPSFNYSGTSYLIEDNNYNWYIKFTSSGTLTFNRSETIDAILVGGGGGGQYGINGSKTRGGGSGYNTKPTGIAVSAGTSYNIVIGSGGARNNGRGGTTSAFGYKAEGGYGGEDGGNGTAKGGYGSNGGDGFLLFNDTTLGYVCGGGAGGYGSYKGGKGGGGDANGIYNANGGNGADNTGGGGAGGSGNSAGGSPGSGGYGGSGIVVIRNIRG